MIKMGVSGDLGSFSEEAALLYAQQQDLTVYEKLSCEYKLEPGFVKMLFKLIIDYCRKVQK